MGTHAMDGHTMHAAEASTRTDGRNLRWAARLVAIAPLLAGLHLALGIDLLGAGPTGGGAWSIYAWALLWVAPALWLVCAPVAGPSVCRVRAREEPGGRDAPILGPHVLAAEGFVGSREVQGPQDRATAAADRQSAAGPELPAHARAAGAGGVGGGVRRHRRVVAAGGRGR